ncbi:DNA segregation ATPase FtsK/SpoIIIE, S-DNA-T family [Pedococcus cremeus]|uniref:DNA segregation ATPase FtsK/SpoIIIE, S-DNA-T family n=1 Tax=Pedococcus cremeus TaxID=587636 RepID=A0A1H9XI74_9MICO|nr:FtsK/SpoIIIE domain-containing protein [Pedococcus cremeus]SES45759.1 DNA segregation ATPase FtsK/SpoIIIE, S-DNA-T family [Pedococcus cremeus]
MGGQSRGALFDSDDIVPVLIEGVLRLVWWVVRTVVALVVFAVRVPLLAVPAAVLVAVGVTYGRPVALWTTLALVVTLIAWRLLGPGTFGRWVRPQLSAAWKTVAYEVAWRRIAPRVGLVVHDHGPRRRRAGEVAGLAWVKVTPAGVERLGIGLPAGLTPDDVAAKTDAIAHAFRAREARIAPSGPGGVVIELHRKDVLATTIRPLPVQAADRVNLAGIPIGRHEDGSPWCFSLWQTHVLIAGATGAGKGSILWSLLNGLSPAINDGWVQVWAIDPKGGMELRPGARLFSRFEDGTPETMCDLLEDLVAVMDARAKRLATQGIRKHQPSPDSPHVLAVIDELATLTAFAERSVVRRIEQALGLLLTKGRAVGITVLAAVQDPGKDVVGWRDLFPTRVAMRLDNPIQVDMVLGEGARDVGATADHICETTPGVAFVRVEGTRAVRRVRASYLADDDIAALASRVTAWPALTAPRPAPVPAGPFDAPAPPRAEPPTAPETPAPARSEDQRPPASAAPQRKPRKPRKARTTSTPTAGVEKSATDRGVT